MVGGKGNEKTTSDGQRACASVGVFWFPPSQVSTSRGEVAAGRLPSWSRALSLGLPVRTALEFGGLQRASAPPTQGPYPPHTHSSTTHTRAVLPRSDPYPSRASGRAARPPPLQPHPLPLPRLQMATPRARLTAPRRRPAAAGGRSLPPSCCGKTGALGEQAELLRCLRLGRKPGRQAARRSCARRRSPAAPGEESRGRAQGGDMLNPPILPSSPTLTSALPLRTTATPQRRGRGSR